MSVVKEGKKGSDSSEESCLRAGPSKAYGAVLHERRRSVSICRCWATMWLSARVTRQGGGALASSWTADNGSQGPPRGRGGRERERMSASRA